MPANLTPQYFEAEKAFKEAKTLDDKIAAMEEMLAVIPKHKGTDKLQADLRKRLSKLRTTESKKKGPGGKASPYKIDRYGAGLVAMIGPPNSGKSSILKALSKAEPEVAPYPFTTRSPVPGVIGFDNVKITLVDTPPISEDFRDADLPGFLRKADLILLVLDLNTQGVLDQFEAVRDSLAEVKLFLKPEAKPPEGPGQPQEIKTILVAAKMDQEGAADNVEAFKELYPEFPLLALSSLSGEGMEEFTRAVFKALDVVRAYTKKPGKEPEFSEPVFLKRGQTVLDFARDIHKDFAEGLKFARIWGKGVHDGQTVARDHVVNDGDILELHL